VKVEFFGGLVDLRMMGHEEMMSKFSKKYVIDNGIFYADREAFQREVKEGIEKERKLRSSGIQTYEISLGSMLEALYMNSWKND
jgi:hypothetical protein